MKRIKKVIAVVVMAMLMLGVILGAAACGNEDEEVAGYMELLDFILDVESGRDIRGYCNLQIRRL